MSFIGPRPERPQFVIDLGQKIRYYDLRHCLKPGLAGWAQLRYPYGASEADAEEKLKYDLYYVKNHNLLFALLILFQTRSEEHTSELQSLMRTSYAVFCLNK